MEKGKKTLSLLLLLFILVMHIIFFRLCKLETALWKCRYGVDYTPGGLEIPFKNLMVIGIDTNQTVVVSCLLQQERQLLWAYS